MKAGSDTISNQLDYRQDKHLFFHNPPAGIWELILVFSKRNYWWLITCLGLVVILIEMGEHLEIIQNPNLFFYGEIILITILLILTGLVKTSSKMTFACSQEKTGQREKEEALIQKQLLEQRIQIIHKEIARDLHDTLGQNISYLRMRLEHLADAGLPPKENLSVDIRRLADVAGESYDLMRGTLAALQPKASNGLHPLLSGYAQQVAERASIQIDIHEQGCPRPLPSHILFQLFLIFREAIHNIEKHACAVQVWGLIEWSETGLRLSISDNGCGFDPVHLEQNGHYGLRNMRERTAHLNGQFSIHSTKGLGTTVVVCL